MALIYNVDWAFVHGSLPACARTHCGAVPVLAMYLDCGDGCCHHMELLCQNHMTSALRNAVEKRWL